MMLQEQLELERMNGLRFSCPYYFSTMLCGAVGLGLCACLSIIAIRNAFTVSFLSVVSVFFLAMVAGFWFFDSHSWRGVPSAVFEVAVPLLPTGMHDPGIHLRDYNGDLFID